MLIVGSGDETTIRQRAIDYRASRARRARSALFAAGARLLVGDFVVLLFQQRSEATCARKHRPDHKLASLPATDNGGLLACATQTRPTAGN